MTAQASEKHTKYLPTDVLAVNRNYTRVRLVNTTNKALSQ